LLCVVRIRFGRGAARRLIKGSTEERSNAPGVWDAPGSGTRRPVVFDLLVPMPTKGRTRLVCGPDWAVVFDLLLPIPTKARTRPVCGPDRAPPAAGGAPDRSIASIPKTADVHEFRGSNVEASRGLPDAGGARAPAQPPSSPSPGPDRATANRPHNPGGQRAPEPSSAPRPPSAQGRSAARAGPNDGSAPRDGRDAPRLRHSRRGPTKEFHARTHAQLRNQRHLTWPTPGTKSGKPWSERATNTGRR
jgi:hypothetical protein